MRPSINHSRHEKVTEIEQDVDKFKHVIDQMSVYYEKNILGE